MLINKLWGEDGQFGDISTPARNKAVAAVEIGVPMIWSTRPKNISSLTPSHSQHKHMRSTALNYARLCTQNTSAAVSSCAKTGACSTKKQNGSGTSAEGQGVARFKHRSLCLQKWRDGVIQMQPSPPQRRTAAVVLSDTIYDTI